MYIISLVKTRNTSLKQGTKRTPLAEKQTENITLQLKLQNSETGYISINNTYMSLFGCCFGNRFSVSKTAKHVSQL